MGARFDKWLARPSTLHFLRRIVGLESTQSTPRRTRPLPRSYHIWRRLSTHREDERFRRHGEVEKAALRKTGNINFNARKRRVLEDLGMRGGLAGNGHDTLAQRDYDPGSEDGSDYFAILCRETDVGAESFRGHLLIDSPQNAGNFEAWKRVLETQQRLNGWKGVMDVWKGMQIRSIELPVHGQLAEDIWSVLIKACVTEDAQDDHFRILEELYDHAKMIKARIGESLPTLHQHIVGRFLRILPGYGNVRVPGSGIARWHADLGQDGFTGPNTIRDIAREVILSTDSGVAFRKFRSIYQKSDERCLYDFAMPLVLEHAEEEKVATWHRLFVTNNDLPSAELASDPAIRFMFKWTQNPQSKGMKESSSLGPTARAVSQESLGNLFTRSSMSSLVGEVHGIKPKAISDSFCARMFATQAFSVEFVVRGLAFLGVDALGPLSLRELATRSGSPESFLQSLHELKEAGVQIVDCIYIRILSHVATKSWTELFHALLASDQHPENYDDKRMQESLFIEFLAAEDWPQIHLTLTGLLLSDREMSATAWNRLLQHCCKKTKYTEVVQMLGHIQSEKLHLSATSLSHLTRYILAERNESKRPVKGSSGLPHGYRSLDVVSNAHMYAVEHGTLVEFHKWIELLKRYGMTHRMDGVERLAIWIAELNAKQHESPGSHVLTPDAAALDDQFLLRNVFNPNMVRALVIWGWRSASVRDRLKPGHLLSPESSSQVTESSRDAGDVCAPWARGLLLLKRLRALGVWFSDDEAKAGVRHCLWTMFGPGYSKLPINQEAASRNQLSLADYVRHANHLWGDNLFDVDTEWLDCRRESESHLSRAIFGDVKSIDRKLGHYVDVAAWVADKTALLSSCPTN